MAPIRVGDIVVHDVLGLGIDLVATRAVRLAEEFGLRCVITGAFDADRVIDQLKERDVTVAFGPVIMSRWMDEVKRPHPENAVALLDSGIRTAIIAGHPNYPAKYLRISLGLLVGRGDLS
jgi:imidazolonepropionase-like amidohydrolase